jgi:hypothetical protein
MEFPRGRRRTVAAVVVALWQAAKARREVLALRKYQNWLEQKRLEEQYLARALDILDEPFRVATDFFFSGARLLAGIPTNIKPTPAQEQEVLDFLERFAREAGTHESKLAAYLNIIGALRELHRSRGNTAEATEYDQLVKEVDRAFNAASDLREWLADPDVIRSTGVDTFVDEPYVSTARDAIQQAERTIARRLVRLYENPPLG